MWLVQRAAEAPGVGGEGVWHQEGGRYWVSSLGSAGTCLLPPWSAGCHGRGLLRGESSAGKEAEKGGPPGRLLATEAEEPGVGGERRKDDRCCRCVRAPQGSLQAGGKQAGAHTIARDAQHRGGHCRL